MPSLGPGGRPKSVKNAGFGEGRQPKSGSKMVEKSNFFRIFSGQKKLNWTNFRPRGPYFGPFYVTFSPVWAGKSPKKAQKQPKTGHFGPVLAPFQAENGRFRPFFAFWSPKGGSDRVGSGQFTFPHQKTPIVACSGPP